MRDRSFFRHALLYGLSTALVQAGGVVLVPVYTRCLSKADFGTLEVLSRCADLTVALLLLSGLRQGLVAFYQQSGSAQEREQVVRATLMLATCVSVLVGAAMMALAGPLCGLLQPEPGTAMSALLLRLAVLPVLLEPLVMMPLALLQARAESATFVAVTASQFLVRVLLCVALAVWGGLGVSGVLLASVLTAGGYGVCLTVCELRRGSTSLPSRKQLAELLWFALPFLPGGVARD